MCLLIPLKREHKRCGALAENICTEYMNVAESNITVYKILVKSEGDLVSPHMHYIYKPGESYKAEFTYADHATSHIGYNRVYDHLVLHGGLHSYSSIDSAVRDVSYEYGEVVCEFTIPKGALVFKEGTEVCANAYKFERVIVHANA